MNTSAVPAPVYDDSLRVEWVNGNQQWMITGGGLPKGAAWDGFDSYDAAVREAHAIGEDICAEVKL